MTAVPPRRRGWAPSRRSTKVPEIILGPLFAQSVSVVGQVARARNIPVIAFSTDTNVASAGVYLLSFLPESDVERIVQYAASTGKRSYAALIPDNPYGHRGRSRLQAGGGAAQRQLIALEHYPMTRPLPPGRSGTCQTAARIDALFIPTAATRCRISSRRLPGPASILKKIQLLGTGLWDDQRISSNPALDGGWYAAPDGAGYRGFAERYRARSSRNGAHRDALLRRRRPDRGPGEDAGHAALQPRRF